MKLGAFTFVLHSHMPFYRGAGKWPHGEENLHEVMAETYVPLLEALTDLHEAGVPARITLGITPVLAEQLADPLIIQNFEAYVTGEIEAAASEIERFEAKADQHFLYLAHFYHDMYTRVLQVFRERFGRDIIAGFRRLQDAGVVEIVTSGATHPYLPLMMRDSTIHAHLEIGKRATERHFGKAPNAIWLPECAYRPGYYAVAEDGTQYERPGIEYWLQKADLGLFFSESSAVEGGTLLGQTQQETREVMREVTRVRELVPAIYDQAAQTIEEMDVESAGFVTEKYVVPFDMPLNAGGESGTSEAYLVRDSEVAVLGRNRIVGEQVWSAMFGYPGDGDYREFHRKDEVHGFQYWRVTDNKADLAYKLPYDPYKAGQRVQAHAAHFVKLVESQLREYAETHGRAGIVASAYDTELFGHWWFEGVEWLKEVLARLAQSEYTQLATASQCLTLCPAEKVIDLPESSWGHAGTHVTWINPETSWMWEAVHKAERRMEDLVERFPNAEGDAEVALNQAARELVLLEASDWECLYTTGQARQYAGDRFAEHVNRFNALADAVEQGDASAAGLARQYGERDNLFPDIDYKLFASRQPD
ncbi:MAG TPA: 1,4-alpha-glucan branching protein domain-containing protein [Chloroflexia bacterium]|nr:1,4-alpha-glucan branching protein domain-containing protein [Chloroflexia bacterium]